MFIIRLCAFEVDHIISPKLLDWLGKETTANYNIDKRDFSRDNQPPR